MIWKRFSFYLALAGLAGGIFLIRQQRQEIPPPKPLAEPARSPFSNSVAARGIIEAAHENVRISPIKPGLIQAVMVEVGSKVKKGDPLIQLDDRESKARLETVRSQWMVLTATLEEEKVKQADLRDQFERIQALEKEKIAAIDERLRREFALKAATARVARVEADQKALEAQTKQAEVELEILTVRAPRDGTILQVNTRAGEYASLISPEPLMVLGEVDTLQVRADVDEQNAPLVQARQPAVAFLKGDTLQPMDLKFVRIEPFVVPKKSLTGDSVERVDTRVLQIIFQMQIPRQPIYVGQQVDVFIQREGRGEIANSK